MGVNHVLKDRNVFIQTLSGRQGFLAIFANFASWAAAIFPKFLGGVNIDISE